jgi:hypothetical protein
MHILESTERYEQWLGQRLSLVWSDLKLKHQLMAEDRFAFFRGTFYRWVQLWREKAKEWEKAPKVLGVSDLHVANFGTWRDSEGRLVWGINDFDEAEEVPYTVDLIRLAASAWFAERAKDYGHTFEAGCEAIVDGYQECLACGGMPLVLADRNAWLRDLALARVKAHQKYWEKFERTPNVRHPLPAEVCMLLEQALPRNGLDYRVIHRIAGVGSLGRQRFLAIAEWQGGKVGREAKVLTTSAWNWMSPNRDSAPVRYPEILQRGVRIPDPHLQANHAWVVRRLSPDCCRIDLESIPDKQDSLKLLRMMGWETGNIHLGARRRVKDILKHLKKQKSGWLSAAAEFMAEAGLDDWKKWRKSQQG